MYLAAAAGTSQRGNRQILPGSHSCHFGCHVQRTFRGIQGPSCAVFRRCLLQQHFAAAPAGRLFSLFCTAGVFFRQRGRGCAFGRKEEVLVVMPSMLTVSQVNRFLKSLIEGDGRLNDVLITGEISNYTDHYRSGHLYFSLKDEAAVLKAVMFASSAKRLKFAPRNGMKVIVRGRVSVYEPSGQYQLYAEEMQPDGIGALSLAFEQLKQKLETEGLFDREYKKPIPRYPRRIGVITSPTGAAVRDILQITARRWPVAEIIFCPVLVQGETAAAQMVAALRGLNREGCCDVILLGRGGGSIEDLWAFNDEELAREVFASEIPVISAVGHETDFTICDFAADLRAPTPSAAAELCTPDRREEAERLVSYHAYFLQSSRELIEYLRQSVDILVEDSPLGNPERYLSPLKEKLEKLQQALADSLRLRAESEKSRLSLLTGALDALSPLKVLSRGYAVLFDERGTVFRRAADAVPGKEIVVRLSDGSFCAQVQGRTNTPLGYKEK